MVTKVPFYLFTLYGGDGIIADMQNGYRDWLRLVLIPGIGPHRILRLLAKFRSPDRVLTAGESELTAALGEPLIAHRIAAYRDSVDVDGELGRIDKYGVTLISLDDDLYPTRLAETYGPPVLFYVRGTLLPRDTDSVSVVGTRRASHYGRVTAERLAEELAARGITVVSGLAAGIDSAAHRGALRAGGRTIAVLGCGVDVVYPTANEKLMAEIIERGCVISEFPMGTTPYKQNFPQRNRIISGMTLGTVVVEGGRTSGALITARRALEQGREVFAVPGRALDEGSQGPHSLIRDGAKLTETVQDILEEIEVYLSAPAAEPAPAENPVPADDLETRPVPADSSGEKRVLAALTQDPVNVDELAARCELALPELLGALTLLEIKGLARQLPGKLFVRI